MNALGETVAGDDKKIKPDPASKTNAPSKGGSTTDTDTAPPKAESGEKAPVTKAYRENWNAIFGKKKKR